MSIKLEDVGLSIAGVAQPMSAVFKLPGGEHVRVTSDGKDSTCEAFDTKMEGAVSTKDRTVVADPAHLLRYCGDQPGDDWVKRVERLNGMIDVMREERGEVVA